MEGDPPLGPCPSWCQKTPGHGWEDEWRDGLVREHTFFREVGGDKYHKIGIHEWEQAAPEGIRRQRELVLDVEAPTNWGLSAALEGQVIYAEIMKVAVPDWPLGGKEVR